MGNYVNKLFSHTDEDEKEGTKIQSSSEEAVIENEGMYTPPVTQRKLPIDPRSVTAGIDRTPIEVNCTPVGLNKRIITAIPRHLQTKPYLETDIDMVMAVATPKKRMPESTEDVQSCSSVSQNQKTEMDLTPTVKTVIYSKVLTPIEMERYKILGIDPRSPASDFNRTPILMPKSIECLKARCRENSSRRGSYETDVLYPRFSYCETLSPFSIPEIGALPDFASHSIKSLNLVDIDCNDRMNKSGSSSSSDTSTIKTICENEEITVIENQKLKCVRTSKKMDLDPILINHEISALREKHIETEDEIKISIPKQNTCNNLHNGKNVQYKETYAADSDRIKVWRDSLSSENPEENELIESDNAEVVKDKKVGKKKKCLKSDIKVVTDEKTFNSEEKNGNESSKIRTPLRNRSNNGQMQSLSTKSPQQLFRNKGRTPKMLQENTPPHKRCVVKSKLNGMQWDPDSTVII